MLHIRNRDKQFIRDIVVCPNCRGGGLSFHQNEYILCGRCGYKYEMHDGIPILLTEESVATINRFYCREEPHVRSGVHTTSYFQRLLRFIEPPPRTKWGDNRAQKLHKALVHISDLKGGEAERKPVIVAIGNIRMKATSKADQETLSAYDTHAIRMDITVKPGIDMVADGYRLPFSAESIDLIVAQATLKHLSNPIAFIDEVRRVLKSNGLFYAEFAYLLAFHRWPGDYFRYTPLGISELLKEFEIVDVGPSRGPSYTFAEIVSIYLACLLSFNNRYLYGAFRRLFGWILHPIRYADYLLSGNRWADQICQVNYCLAKKP